MCSLPDWIYPMSNLYLSLIDDMGDAEAKQTVNTTLAMNGISEESVNALIDALNQVLQRERPCVDANALIVADLMGIDKRVMKLICSTVKAIDEISALNFACVDDANFDGDVVHCTSRVYSALDEERKSKVKKITVTEEEFDPSIAPHVEEWDLVRLPYLDKKYLSKRKIFTIDTDLGTQGCEPSGNETVVCAVLHYVGGTTSIKVTNLRVYRLCICSFERLGTVEVLDCDELEIHDIPMTDVHSFKTKLMEWYGQFKTVRVGKVNVSDFLERTTMPIGTLLGEFRSRLNILLCSRRATNPATVKNGNLGLVTEKPELANDRVRLVDNIDVVATEGWDTICASISDLPWTINTVAPDHTGVDALDLLFA